MKWYKITIHTVTEAVEALSYQLEEQLNAKGVEIFDPKDILMQKKNPLDWDYIDEELLKDLSRDEVLMSVYFSEEELATPQAVEEKQLAITSVLKEISAFLPVGSGKMDLCMMAEEDWANNWKKYYHPFRIGRIFVIPSWLEEETKSQIEEQDLVIHMDPGMAFGSGTHETTSMCTEFLQEVMKPGATVFDVGCGSGILGIAAAKLGAGRVYCTDLDANAVLVSGENVVKNEVADRTTVHKGDLLQIEALKGVEPQIVVANIIADVIISFCPDVYSVLPKEGLFISSGIIKERLDEVKEALNNAGYTILEIKNKGNWAAVLSRK